MRFPLLLAYAFTIFAQPRTFEVAAIRRIVDVVPTPPPGDGPPPPPPPPVLRPVPTGLTLDGGTIQYCLSWAYGLPSFQINGPEWIRVNRYSISARTAGPVEPDQLKPMLVALLEERFRIAVRRERKEDRILALVADRGGAKLKPADPAAPPDRKFSPIPGGGLRIVARNTPVDAIVQILTLPLWPIIVDRTGLTGGFDFTFERPPQDPTNREAWLSDIRAALQKQLGLTLSAQRGPVETVMVEGGSPDPIGN